MTTRITLQPAYLLHARPYRETSLLAELLTQDYGRVNIVIKGARQSRSRYGSVRPFTPLLVSYQGKTDLFNLTEVEAIRMPYPLEGDALFCGFYLNELLIRLLLPQDPYPYLFGFYQKTLQLLCEAESLIEPLLRQFEWSVLNEIGYGFSLDQTQQQEPVLNESYYLFDSKRGFVRALFSQKDAFRGEHLLKFKQNQWEDPQTRLSAKRLMKMALAPLLGKKPLKTRDFFNALQSA